MHVLSLPVSAIWPDAGQPRRDFEPQALSELAASIRTVGVRQPIHVAPDGDGWQIRDGERRWRAARLAGLVEVPCLVQASESWLATRQHQIVTNALQQPLTPLEDAQALYALWLGYQVEALEQMQEGPSASFQRALTAALRPTEQIALLEQRLCQLAGAPEVAAYLGSGRVAVPWQQVLDACGRSEWSADRRKKHLAVLRVDLAVQELLAGVELSARTLRELAGHDAPRQRELIEAAMRGPLAEMGEALRAALAREDEQAGPVFYARESVTAADEVCVADKVYKANETCDGLAADSPLLPALTWASQLVDGIEQHLLGALNALDNTEGTPTTAQINRLSPLLMELNERVVIDAR